MKFDAMYKPEKCCAKETTRYAIEGAFFDAEKGRLCSTNGRSLLVVPAIKEDGDHSAIIPVSALSYTRFKSRPAECQIKMNGSIVVVNENGDMSSQPVDGKFPAIDDVIPKKKEGTFRIGLSVALLKDLADGMGVGGLGKSVVLTIDPSKEGNPIRVDPNDDENAAFGVLMPVVVRKN